MQILWFKGFVDFVFSVGAECSGTKSKLLAASVLFCNSSLSFDKGSCWGLSLNLLELVVFSTAAVIESFSEASIPLLYSFIWAFRIWRRFHIRWIAFAAICFRLEFKQNVER